MAEAAIRQDESDALKVHSESGEVLAGSSVPWGANESGDGLNFALFSRHAAGVRLEIHQNADYRIATRIIDPDPGRYKTGDIWHMGVRSAVNSTDIASNHRINWNKDIASIHLSCFWIRSEELLPVRKDWDFSAPRGCDSSSSLTDLTISTRR